MKNWLSSVDRKLLNWLKVFGRKADDLQLPAYVVGGFVRDVILGRKNLDLDIIVEGDAIVFAQALAQEHNASIVIYKQFGTATIMLPDGLRIDFATARRESYPTSGALPVVRPGQLKDDLLRRDFTINAMAIVINSERFGQLIDEFSGLPDLKAKKIRILHELSFKDDPTRLLRAVRFEQRFNFRMDQQTLALFKQAVAKKYDRNVKLERYFEEFKKMLLEDHPDKNISRLAQLKAMGFLGTQKNLSAKIALVRKAADHSKKIRKKHPGKKIDSAWMIPFLILMDGLPQKAREDFPAQLNFKKSDRDKSISFSLNLPSLKKLKLKRLSPSEIYRILKPLSLEELIVLDARGNEIIRKRIADFLDRYSAIQLNINGTDLETLGIPSGQEMGKMLEQILYDKIDGLLLSREDELKKARELQALFNGRS